MKQVKAQQLAAPQQAKQEADHNRAPQATQFADEVDQLQHGVGQAKIENSGLMSELDEDELSKSSEELGAPIYERQLDDESIEAEADDGSSESLEELEAPIYNRSIRAYGELEAPIFKRQR